MATRISLKKGDRVFHDNIEYEIIRPESLTSVHAFSLDNGEERTLDIQDLTLQLIDEDGNSYDDLDTIDEEKREQALQRFELIKPVLLRNISRAEVVKLAQKHGVHYTTIYRLVRQFKQSMSPAALVSKTHLRGGHGQQRIDKSVEKLIKDHFQDIVDKGDVDITKLTTESLRRDIDIKCKNLQLRTPSWVTVDNRLSLFLKEKKLDRKKKRKGGRYKTMAGGIFPDADFPLAVVQIDHTPLDMVVVDDESREPIGRPYLSIAIDVFSRMIVGFSLSLDPPNIFSVGRLIAQCILPKKQFLEDVGVDANWDIFGLMGVIHVDNAGEFRTQDFIPFQEEYLIDIRWRPVASPEYGGHIERLAKTLNTYIHEEPGTTMGNIIEREGYDSEGKACYAMDAIEKWLTILITKIYHVKDHSSLKNNLGEKLNPIEKYTQGLLGDKNTPGIGLPDVVEDQDRLKIFLLPSFERCVQQTGIELDHIFYFDNILKFFHGQKGPDGKGKKFLIKRDPRRITPIYFFDPDSKKFYPIPYRDMTKAPISLWELKKARKRCIEKGLKNPNEQQVFQAHTEMRQIREEEVAKTKKARRERQAEKRRDKDQPIYQETTEALNSTCIENEELADDKLKNLYDDPSLLDGVVVKDSKKEGPSNV